MNQTSEIRVDTILRVQPAAEVRQLQFIPTFIQRALRKAGHTEAFLVPIRHEVDADARTFVVELEGVTATFRDEAIALLQQQGYTVEDTPHLGIITVDDRDLRRAI